MRNIVQLYLAANNILLIRKRNHAFLLLAWKVADRFASRRYSLIKKNWWSNDKSVIEHGYQKISWFVSVSKIIIDLLATDKSRYFAQRRPIIINCLWVALEFKKPKFIELM